jgi:DNA-binding YbaB/EbfC family protein
MDDEDEGESAFNLGDLLSQVQQMSEQLSMAQAEAADEIVEGHAGGGAVRIEVTGGLDFRSVTIDPAAIDSDDVSLLEDLVLAALRDAMDRVSQLTQATIGHVGFGAGFGDLSALGDLGALGGLGGLGELLLGEGNADEPDEDGEPTEDAGPANGTD